MCAFGHFEIYHFNSCIHYWAHTHVYWHIVRFDYRIQPYSRGEFSCSPFVTDNAYHVFEVININASIYVAIIQLRKFKYYPQVVP